MSTFETLSSGLKKSEQEIFSLMFTFHDPFLVCPSGYFYAGDDTPVDPAAKDYYVEEGDRSPTYSCYKVIHHNL